MPSSHSLIFQCPSSDLFLGSHLGWHCAGIDVPSALANIAKKALDPLDKIIVV